MKATYLIRSTQALSDTKRYYRYASAALVDEMNAETFKHERTAQQVINCFIESGEWRSGQYRVHLTYR